jgi:hypothetical protein
MSPNSIVDCKSFLREIFIEYFILHPILLWGIGVIVEIKEALLVRRKFNVGRVVRQTWVFGGYEVESKLGFIKIVQDRSRETLYSLIHQHVRPGTTIVSDMWASYSTLNDESFNHLTVNYSLHFVDPVSFATTNHVESTWQKMKQKQKERYKTAEQLYQTICVIHVKTAFW